MVSQPQPAQVPLSFAITASPGPALGARDPQGQDAMERLARDGVNQVRLPAIAHRELEGRTPGRGPLPVTLQAVQDRLDWAERAGRAAGRRMYVAVNLGELSNLQPDTARARWLDYVVERCKDHPALGVWKFYDEPNNPYNAYEKVVRVRLGLHRAYARIQEIDGSHFTWITQAPKPKGRISARFFGTYAGAADIHAVDLYPISDPPGKHADIPNKQPSGVGDYAGRLAEMARTAAANGLRRWVWMVVQGAGWSGALPRDERGRASGPTLMQPAAFMFRYMCYQSIIHGAQGLVIFGMNVGLYADVQPHGWDWGYWDGAVVPLLRELRSPGLAAALAVQQPETVARHTLGTRGVRIDTLGIVTPEGEQFVLASRSERRRGEPLAATVHVPIGRASAGGTAEVVFEGRTAPVSRGMIEDCFWPHEVHVYRVTPGE